MSELTIYLRIGFRHIADLGAWDHILFVAALTAAYGPREWTRIAWLVTAFTIVFTAGVAIRDALAAATAATARAAWIRRYSIAGGFGLVHGLGFAGGLRSLLGAESSITVPLLGFNLGLEAGQLLIVTIIFALGLVAERWLGIVRRDWVLILSGAAGGIGLTLLIDRLTNGPGR